MINNLTIFLGLILLASVQSYPNNQLNNLTNCNDSENVISFLKLLRYIQKSIDQTKQSFNDVVRQNQFWIIRKPNGEEITNKKCIDIINVERTNFANYVLQHENDFENCGDQLIEQYQKNGFTGDLNIMENEALKCISIIRQNQFWAEYEKSKSHFTEICSAED